jgi:hypothetical protein
MKECKPMTDTASQWEQALSLGLRLPAKERLKLAERLVASVETELPSPTLEREETNIHWGQNLLKLLDELGPIELDHPEIDDPVEWVKQIRQDQEIKRGLDWGLDE